MRRIPLGLNQEQYLIAREVRIHRRISGAAFNIVDCMQVRGPVNLTVLEAALNAVVERHAVLRTLVSRNPSWPRTLYQQSVEIFERTGVFEPGMYEQSVLPAFRLTLRCRRLDHLLPAQRMDIVRDVIVEETAMAFDYSARPPVRVRALQMDVDEHAVILTVSHLTADAISLQLLWDDVRFAYDQLIAGAGHVTWEPVPQFHDFCGWQSERQFTSYFERGLDYWREQWREFEGAQLACHELPIARPVAGDLQLGGHMDVIDIDGDVGRGVRALARKLRVTPFVIFLSAFALLLRRWAGRDRVAPWIICANRQQEGANKTIGWLANSHIIGLNLESTLRGRDVIEQTRATVLKALEHQDVPLPLLWRKLGRRSDQAQRARIVFDWYKDSEYSPEGAPASGIRIDRYRIPGRQSALSTGLSVKAIDGGHCFSVLVFYSIGQFTTDAIALAIRDFEALLGDLVEKSDCSVTDIGQRLLTC